MREVVRETRRVLKPKGSAVFILQPNSVHVGQMRLRLSEFMAEQAREWNVVQDIGGTRALPRMSIASASTDCSGPR